MMFALNRRVKFIARLIINKITKRLKIPFFAPGCASLAKKRFSRIGEVSKCQDYRCFLPSIILISLKLLLNIFVSL